MVIMISIMIMLIIITGLGVSGAVKDINKVITRKLTLIVTIFDNNS